MTREPTGLTTEARGPLIVRTGTRTAVYVPRDRVHEKALRGAMARHGWWLARRSAETDGAGGPRITAVRGGGLR